MIYTGWGLGNFFGGTVTMTPEYDEARESIARARMTVFVLDVTQANYHSLETGLETIAEDTGGTYETSSGSPAAARSCSDPAASAASRPARRAPCGSTR
jgi:hypothetical protein